MSEHHSNSQPRDGRYWVSDHGQSRSRLYRSVWQNMHARCYRSSTRGFHNYGGRGIRVCDEWHSYKMFGIWAEASGYRDDLTLDRIDPNGSYDPTNCRWIPNAEQARTMRKCKRVVAFGETKTEREWSRDPRCLVTYGSLRVRLMKGWEPEKAIMTPPSARHVANAMSGFR